MSEQEYFEREVQWQDEEDLIMEALGTGYLVDAQALGDAPGWRVLSPDDGSARAANTRLREIQQERADPWRAYWDGRRNVV